MSNNRDAGRVRLRMLDRRSETLPRGRDVGVPVTIRRNQKAPLERRRKERSLLNDEF